MRCEEKELIILDTTAAHIFWVTITEVRQAIGRNKAFFEGAAFHLTFDELAIKMRLCIIQAVSERIPFG